jgi:hypothetical protein
LRELLSKYFSKYDLYSRDIDLTLLDSSVQHKLSYLTQTSTNKLVSMQLLHLEGIIQKHIQTETRNKWVISSRSNTNLKLRSSKCLRVCPICLKKDTYFKQAYKLLFMNICRKHQIHFIDACQKCFAPILPMRIVPPKKIFQCFQCGYDLRNAIVTRAFKEEIDTSIFFEYCIKRKFILHNKKKISTLDYFTVLHLIAKNLHKTFPSDEIFTSSQKITKLTKRKSHYLLYQPIPYLAQILSLSHNLIFKEWDGELLNFLKRHKLMYASQLLNKRENVNKNIPLWFFEHMQTLWIKRKKINLNFKVFLFICLIF